RASASMPRASTWRRRSPSSRRWRRPSRGWRAPSRRRAAPRRRRRKRWYGAIARNITRRAPRSRGGPRRRASPRRSRSAPRKKIGTPRMGCLLGRITRRAQPRRLQWLGMMAFCLSSVSMTRPAAAQATTRPTAKGYLEHGLRLYGDGQYDAAIRELRLGYALEPLPQILYTLGQAERKLGRCDQAIGYYKEYLRSADATSAGAARFQIERCEQQQRDAAAAAAARAPAPTPVAAPAPAVTVAATPPPPRRPV